MSTHVAAIMRHEKRRHITSLGVQYHCTLFGIETLNLRYFEILNSVFEALNKTH